MCHLECIWTVNELLREFHLKKQKVFFFYCGEDEENWTVAAHASSCWCSASMANLWIAPTKPYHCGIITQTDVTPLQKLFNTKKEWRNENWRLRKSAIILGVAHSTHQRFQSTHLPNLKYRGCDCEPTRSLLLSKHSLSRTSDIKPDSQNIKNNLKSWTFTIVLWMQHHPLHTLTTTSILFYCDFIVMPSSPLAT